MDIITTGCSLGPGLFDTKFHAMSDQLYCGFALRFLRQREKRYRCLIYTSNMSQSGFWIRVYASAAIGG